MKKLYILLFCLLAAPALAVPPETAAKNAVVLDFATGQVLMDKGGETRIPTASMSKVATLYEVFAALKAGTIKLTDTFPVSERAWRMEGSRMFLDLGTQVSVEDLIRGVAVQSGNDACVVLAEGIAGSEGEFVMRMNARAKALGLRATHFADTNGLPDPAHYSTPSDLARLGAAVIRDFPEYYHYFAQEDFTYNSIKQMNRNPLLYRAGLGADGIKTGHTQEAGYGLIGSAVSPVTQRRVVVVVAGLPDEPARAAEGAKLLEWGLSAFANRALFEVGQEVARAPVVKGSVDAVPLVPARGVVVTLPRGADGAAVPVTAEARLPAAPLIAPVAKGAEVGTLRIAWEGGAAEVPLLAGAEVPRAGPLTRIFQNALDLLGR